MAGTRDWGLGIRELWLLAAGCWLKTDCNKLYRPKDRFAMTNTTVLISDMAILAVIFLLGTLAKIFPKSGRKAKQ